MKWFLIQALYILSVSDINEGIQSAKSFIPTWMNAVIITMKKAHWNINQNMKSLKWNETWSDSCQWKKKIKTTLKEWRPFSLQSTLCTCQCFLTRKTLFVVTTTSDMKSQPDSTKQKPQNATMKLISLIYCFVCNSHPSLPPPQITWETLHIHS